ARRYKYSVRLLDLALEPMPFAPCRISYLAEAIEVTCDERGIARFATEDFVPSCEVEWQPTENAQSEPISRVVRFTRDEQLDACLENLGYLQANDQEDERLSSFEQEFGLPPGSPESEELLIAWHDR